MTLLYTLYKNNIVISPFKKLALQSQGFLLQPNSRDDLDGHQWFFSFLKPLTNFQRRGRKLKRGQVDYF